MRTQMPRATSPRRGYALMIALVISMVLAIGIGTMISTLVAAEKTTGRQRLNREAYYVCDGVARVLTRTTVDLLADVNRFEDVDNVEDRLRAAVFSRHGNNLNQILPPGYATDGDDGFAFRNVDENAAGGTVAAGRYRGLSGDRRTFSYDLALRKERGSTCRTNATVDSIRVPMSQLSIFATEDLRICPSWSTNDVVRRSRIHVNGNLDVGRYALPRTTITGDLSPGCGSSGLRFCVGELPCFSASRGAAEAVNEAGDAVGAIPTDIFANGRRGTSTLKFPQAPGAVQAGVFADTRVVGEATDNSEQLRFLLDPGLPGDGSALRSQRLAHQALIRILDGVWYLNDGTWPGRVIWSDHPGNFSIDASNSPDERALVGADIAVGQNNIRNAFGLAGLPELYSYYDDDSGNDERGVVSYGEIRKKDGRHRPMGRRLDSGALVADDSGTRFAQARRAARSGFVDAHVRGYHERVGGPDTGNILPINIDVSALQAALASTAPGELGNQLQRLANDLGRPELAAPTKLLVWVGTTWTGSTRGLLTADERPGKPSSIDGTCVDSDGAPVPAPLCVHAIAVDAPLPYPMCSASNCLVSRARRPNAVRVYNAAAALPSGVRLSIVTPLPLYVLGSVDRGDPTAMPSLPTGAIGSLAEDELSIDNGPDVFLAGDTVTLLSDGWSDRGFLPVGASLPTMAVVSNSDVAAYNASFMMGRYVVERSRALHPFGLERSFRFLERSPSLPNAPIIAGAIVVGFHSVYDTGPACYSSALADDDCSDDSAWRHLWNPTLANLSAAPPGMPAFVLRGVGETIPDSLNFNLSALFGGGPFGF